MPLVAFLSPFSQSKDPDQKQTRSHLAMMIVDQPDQLWNLTPPAVVVFCWALLQVVQLSSVNSCQTQIMDDYHGSFFVWFIVNQIQLEFPPNMFSNRQPSVVQWSSVVTKWASIVPAISPVWASMACLLLFLSLDMFWAVWRAVGGTPVFYKDASNWFIYDHLR